MSPVLVLEEGSEFMSQKAVLSKLKQPELCKLPGNEVLIESCHISYETLRLVSFVKRAPSQHHNTAPTGNRAEHLTKTVYVAKQLVVRQPMLS